MSDFLFGIVAIAIGCLAFWRAESFASFFSAWTNKWEKDGVVRQSGFPATKIWREDEPEKFASRIRLFRGLAQYTLWFTRIWGTLFACGGIVATISGLIK